ncbi:asialoglycoprotein receptor 1-like [Macrosteles quadrilineatus]|uniref:asialoglycoprotein receptor 1-like n=1 Tax=Macrosteles quadrilineatus TaxID=74068 RepID=UPI0023E1E690|nr:asialoglycoprotein receptor 1-like [Macrosteles quadrilineatus]
MNSVTDKEKSSTKVEEEVVVGGEEYDAKVKLCEDELSEFLKFHTQDNNDLNTCENNVFASNSVLKRKKTPEDDLPLNMLMDIFLRDEPKFQMFLPKRFVNMLQNEDLRSIEPGSLYLVSHGVTWQEASDNCQAKGHKLAVVFNQEQQKKFEEAVNRYAISLGSRIVELWIGLKSEDKKFKWMDGTELELPDWLPGEPNLVGRRDFSEVCVEAVPEESNRPLWPGGKPYQWNDGWNCFETKRYFCEEEIPNRY